MENEKMIWDMDGKHILRVILKYWVIVMIIAVLVGGGYFVYQYYDTIIKKNYESRLQYNLTYSVKVYDKDGNVDYKISSPDFYTNIYESVYTNDDVYVSVAEVLAGYSDPLMHYNNSEIKRMTRIRINMGIITISVTSKDPLHSEIILKRMQEIAEQKLKTIVDEAKQSDTAGQLSEAIIQYPETGINYDGNVDTVFKLILIAVLVFIGVFIAISAVMIIIANFNGKFKRRDVFENNYQIPILGEISIRIMKR